ncbi:MAG TPA: hypothetical protein VEZ14_04225 [Dehalococcoidia bacterium]|nr:hypothetical protein [Dehalococcoidia bacterium]
MALAALLGATVTVVSADNTDPNNSNARYGWGENVGWLSARPTGEAYGPGGAGVQVSDTDVTGYLWGENIGWINLSCKNDASCGGGAGAWGVKNDGTGKLTGYAWSENAGWISFSCQNNPPTCASTGSYGVTIDNFGVSIPHKSSGIFAGYAWGENIGWISFNCSNTSSCGAVPYGVQTGWPDSDGDGYTDSTEATLVPPGNPFSFCPIMRADVTGDHVVAINDLGKLALVFGQAIPPAPARYDQDFDGKITIVDLGKQALRFGQSVSACP